MSEKNDSEHRVEVGRKDMNRVALAREHKIEGTSRISSKGQVTVPVEIRNALNAKEGDQLRFILKEDIVCIEVVKHLSADQLYGLFSQPEDEGDFQLDLDQARNYRAEEIRNKQL